MLKIMGIALVSGLILGCSGNSSSTRTVDEEAITELGGRIGASTAGARVTAVAINAEGAPVRTLDDSNNLVFDGVFGVSDNTGNYEIILEDEQKGSTLVFIATNDSGDVGYRCESVNGCSGVPYLGNVSISENLDIRAGVSEVGDGSVVNINWITDLASSLARTVYIDAVSNGLSASDRADISQAILDDIDTAKTGVYNEYTIELANLHISKLFGLSDVIFVKPLGPSQITKSNDLSSAEFEESIYVGAIVAALPSLARDKSLSYMSVIELISGNLIQRKGQLLQKDSTGNEIALAEIYQYAASILQENINYFNSNDARVPAEANTVLSRFQQNISTLSNGQETNVQVDVPAELAGWATNIGKAKEFITDLTEALQNFWGEDPTKSSFVDPSHARRVDDYYLAHEAVYNQISPDLIGPTGLLNDILIGVGHLIDCKNGSASCSVADPKFVVSSSNSTVTIDNTLTLTLSPVESPLNEAGTFSDFDINFSATKNSLTRDGVLYEWTKDTISDGSIEETPYIRLSYAEAVITPPSLNDVNGSANVVDPTQITVVWPSLSFEKEISDAGVDSGLHEFTILFETNLLAVNDPVPGGNPEVRYNPFTVVFWVRSSDLSGGNVVNASAFLSQLRTTFSDVYYPDTKWPSTNQFFKNRDDNPVSIPEVVSLYRGVESLDNGVQVDVFDQELIGRPSIIRIRVYPYNASNDSTTTQACFVSKADRELISCSETTLLAGNTTLDSLLESNFKSGVLTNYSVRANGVYSIDLNEDPNERGYNLVSSDGTFNGFDIDVEYGPYTGTFSEPIVLGIDQFSLVFSSMLKEDDALTPIIVEASLTRKTEDLFSANIGYGYAEEDEFSEISDAVGVGVGSNSQGFRLEYVVSQEDIVNSEGVAETIEIEQGGWTIYRSGITLGGQEQSVLASVVSRVEYTQGDQEFACGANDSDKLSSAGDCEAVAYLTFRGALVATIREERDGVFVARFVDGSWMVLGE
jgi:hypothetical protein